MTLTIGKFDGVHRGHQALLQRMMTHGAFATVLTFSNHPFEVLHPHRKVQLISSNAYKLKLLKEFGIDQVISIPFTLEFAHQTPEEFLKAIGEVAKFNTLVLGHDARLGKGRSGTPEVMKELAQKMGFNVEYIEPLTWHGKIISGSLIREGIREGRLEEVSHWLGRSYSLYGTYADKLDLEGLCLLPPGNYAVTVISEKGRYSAIAALENAHLTLNPQPSSGTVVEVVFEGQ